jgi:hypothetical protein
MNIMRHSFILFAFAAATLTSFGQSSTNSTAKTSGAIVGTWQWVKVDQQAIPYPFFMRFYSNGTAATWPAPDGFSTTNGVSRGGYHYDGAVLIVDTGAGTNNPKSQVEIKGDEMVMMTCDETNRYIYHRVIPDLEPGKFLPGHPSHGPPDL